MKKTIEIAFACVLAGTSVASADWKDTVFTDVSRTAPARPVTSLDGLGAVEDWKDDLFTDIGRTAPIRKPDVLDDDAGKLTSE